MQSLYSIELYRKILINDKYIRIWKEEAATFCNTIAELARRDWGKKRKTHNSRQLSRDSNRKLPGATRSVTWHPYHIA